MKLTDDKLHRNTNERESGAFCWNVVQQRPLVIILESINKVLPPWLILKKGIFIEFHSNICFAHHSEPYLGKWYSVGHD